MPLHPFLVAIYMVISIYASNAAQVPAEHIFRPLIFFLFLAGIIYWTYHRISKDINYSAYATSWILLWLGLFGHLFRSINLAFTVVGQTASEFITLALWTFLVLFISAPVVWKNISNKKLVTDVLTAVAAGVVILPLFTTINTITANQRSLSLVQKWQSGQPAIHLAKDADLPDIYYLILDGYGRADVLRELYGFDNSDFLSALTERGFFVAEASHSNYMQTALSLASSMNMEYVNFLSEADSDSRAPAYELLDTNRLRTTLDEAGYEVINIASPVLFTQLNDFDQYHAPGNPLLTEFEKLILSVTPFAPFMKGSGILLPSYESHRVYTFYSFEKLGSLATDPGPKFIFTHIVAPHPPFVFDAMGNPTQPGQPYVVNDATGFPGSRQDYIHGYIGELKFINTLTLQTVDAILRNSARPVIIIIQGDHGPGAYTNLNLAGESCHHERSSIFNAYYFPDQNYSALPADITPVNTFRFILNLYFGTSLPILDNHVYFSYWNDPYNFVEVTDQLAVTCEP